MLTEERNRPGVDKNNKLKWVSHPLLCKIVPYIFTKVNHVFLIEFFH